MINSNLVDSENLQPKVFDFSEIKEIADRCGGYWSVHPLFPLEDWLQEVSEGGTRRGYWEWVLAHIEDAEEDEYMERVSYPHAY